MICSADGLPFDSTNLVAVPRPVGGCLVVSANALFYFKQNIDFILSVNEHGDQLEGYRVVPVLTKEFVGTLHGSVITFINELEAFVVLESGEWLELQLQVLGWVFGYEHFSSAFLTRPIVDRDMVQSITLARSKTSNLPSCICWLDDRHVFLGSRLSDSLLIEYEAAREDENSETFHDRPEDDSNDIGWGFDLRSTSRKLSNRYLLAIRDHLVNAAPIACSTIGFSSFSDAVSREHEGLLPLMSNLKFSRIPRLISLHAVEKRRPEPSCSFRSGCSEER